MALIPAVDYRTRHEVITEDEVEVYNSSLSASWTEVDISSYVRNGSISAICFIDILTSGGSGGLLEFTNDNTMSVGGDAWRNGWSILMSGSRLAIPDVIIPLTTDRKFWIAHHSAEWSISQCRIRLKGYHL